MSLHVKETSRRTGSVLVTISTFSGALVQWYMVWIFARHFGGPAAAGTYSSLISLLTPIFIVASLGLRTVYLTLREVWPLRTYLFLRVVGLAAGGVVFLAVALLEAKFAPGLIIALMASRIFDLLSDVYAGAIQRQDRLAWLGTIGIGASVTAAAAVTVAAYVADSMTAALTAVALVAVLFYVVYWRTAGSVDTDVPDQHLPEQMGVRFPGVRSIISAGVPVTISQGIAGVAAYLPILVLGRWVNEGMIGVFAGAAYLITAANLVGAAAQTILISPFRMQFAAEGPRPPFRRAVRINLFLAVIVLACLPIIVFAGNPVLQFVYGAEFALPRRALVLLAIAVIPIAPSYLFSSLLAVFNYFSVEVYVWASAVAVAASVGVALLTAEFDPLSTGMIIAAAMSWTRFVGVSLCTWWIATRTNVGSVTR